MNGMCILDTIQWVAIMEMWNLKSITSIALKHNRKEKEIKNVLQGELRKLKPPTFNGEKFGEVVEMWLQEMKKYLQLHDYLNNQEYRISIFNL